MREVGNQVLGKMRCVCVPGDLCQRPAASGKRLRFSVVLGRVVGMDGVVLGVDNMSEYEVLVKTRGTEKEMEANKTDGP